LRKTQYSILVSNNDAKNLIGAQMYGGVVANQGHLP